MRMPVTGDGGWRGLAFYAAIATTIVIVIMAFVAEILLLLISAVLFAVGAVLMLRRGNAGPILLGIVALLFLLTDGPFLIPYLRVPASWTNFILACLALLGCVVILVAAIGAIRRRESVGSAPRWVAGVAIALAVVSVGVAAAAGVTYDQPSAKPGDLRMAARDIKFSRASLQASAGPISVFLTNEDTVLHTFTIDRLNVDLNIPASAAARVTFAAPPGRYRYICTLHSDMHGVLTVR